LKRLRWIGTPRVLVDVVVSGTLGGRSQRNRKNMERSKKTDSQQDQMEEFHGCPMLQKELQELMNNNNMAYQCKKLSQQHDLKTLLIHVMFTTFLNL
jgi:hypothetical protein